jgi:hypothetical protein
MQYGKRCMLVILIIASLQLSACAQKSDTSSKIAPAKVERLEGTALKRVTLTAKAAERLGIQTAPAQEVPRAQQRPAQAERMVMLDTGAGVTQKQLRAEGSSGGTGSVKAVPYAAVLYDAYGDTWVYTNPSPLTFLRHRIQIDYIEGDLAVLSDGPAAGTAVVVVGAAELFGTETGIK